MGINYGDDFDIEFKRDNILLYKNSPVAMGQYIVTYVGDSVDNRSTFYKVKYEKIDEKTGEISSSFMLHPYLLQDKKSQQLSPNPDTKHYLTHDVFTHVSSIPAKDTPKEEAVEEKHTIKKGDTIWLSKSYLVLEQIKTYKMSDTIAAGAVFTEHNGEQSSELETRFFLIGNNIGSEAIAFNFAQGAVTFDNILPDTDSFVFTTKEEGVQNDWIIMKAIVFPMINLVWLGMVILAIGFTISMVKRAKDNRRIKTAQ